MNTMTSTGPVWLRPLWLGWLVAGSAMLTAAFTCITPFAAFAVIGALSLSRWTAAGFAVAVWLANQAVGYGVLHYPWNGRSAGWGVAIGVAAAVGTIAAHETLRRVRAMRALAAFVAAFVVYQLALAAAALSVLGGTGAFAPRIVGEALLVNAVAMVGLYGLDQIVTALGGLLDRRRRMNASPARLA